MPQCNQLLTVDSQSGDPVNVGQAAHIAGENDGKGNAPASARFDATMSKDQRDSYFNLIYLCSKCHTTIDALPQGEIDFPVARLLQMKADHELKVRDAMIDAFADVGFVELEEATKWVAAVSPSAITTDFSLLMVEEKIKKNELAQDARAIIAMGLGVASAVSQYIEAAAQTDEDFPERLKAGFLEEYWRLVKDGFHGEELFEFMCRFAQRGFVKQAQRSAGLAVLVHLFEACEVFEK